MSLDTPHKPGDRRFLGQVPAQAVSVLARELCTRHKLIVLIAPDNQSANQLMQDCPAWCKNHEVLLFPDWETLPYDYFSPHQDIISERLRFLARLPTLTQAVIIIPAPSLMQRIAPTGYIQTQVFNVKLGDRWDIATQRRVFEQAGYYCVEVHPIQFP